eukprot:Skav202390  [mRNA]  locus=scaffold1406:411525:413741:- [translate_table: standard]
MDSLQSVLSPLEVRHLGILARCYALSDAATRASDVAALLETTFGDLILPSEIDRVFARLEASFPHLLGGPPLDLHGVLGASTLIRPAVAVCPSCQQLLVLGAIRGAKAYSLHSGWMDVRFQASLCPGCNAEFSNIWQRVPGQGPLCSCVASPSEVTFLQIVACPRSNSKAFIEVRTLWLLRAALLRCKAPFSGFVEMLADLRGDNADREHDSLRFEHHWLIFETLCLLWEDENAAMLLPTLRWPLDTRNGAQAFQQFLRDAVLPMLRAALRKLHFQDHSCDICRAKVVTFDAKYGLTCRLCNHREGGLVHFENIACTVMFGCQNPPVQTGLYCSLHDLGHRPGVRDAPRVLRHRDVDGQRSYKVEGRSSWHLRPDVPRASIVEYETLLAERTERRKKRRGHQASAAVAEPGPDEDAELQFWDTNEPALQQQPDELNPCGIDKTHIQPRRKYGGLLVSTLPCGRVCGATPLAHAESLTQVYALLSTLHATAPQRLEYVFYDNACALARYARHTVRATRTPASIALAGLTYVLDSFHVANHTACVNPSSPHHLPEVLREQHAALAGVNSQTAEQFFSWADPFVRSVVNMTPAVFEVFLLLVTHFYNTMICASTVPMGRRRGTGRRPASSRAPSRRADIAGPASVSSDHDVLPERAPAVRFVRNPHGVGFWGAGKYHWQPDAEAPRPPCNIVDKITLTETVEVDIDVVEFMPRVGYIMVNAGGKHELCKVCARALERAGFL